MTGLVLDASVVAAWFLRGQTTSSADALLDRADEFDFVAPFVFPAEVRSLLLKSERAKRMAAAQSEAALEELRALSIETETPPDEDEWPAIMAMARSEGLSVYDSLYLELSLRRELPLASRDAALLKAAERRGLDPMDLRA